MGSFAEDDTSNTSGMDKASTDHSNSELKQHIRLWLPKSFFVMARYSTIQDAETQFDNEVSLAAQLRKKGSTIRRWRCISGILAAALIITWISILPRSTARYPQPDEGTDNVLKWMKQAEVAPGHHWCGPTTAEAKNRGCTFNKLHNRWMSPNCAADFEPARDAIFKALGGDLPKFIFYRDVDGEPGAEITDDELNDLDVLTPAWTTVGHHMTHCMYLLLQAAAALNLGTKADMVVHAWEHAGHCATVIINVTKTAPGWNDVASFGHTQSGVCW